MIFWIRNNWELLMDVTDHTTRKYYEEKTRITRTPPLSSKSDSIRISSFPQLKENLKAPNFPLNNKILEAVDAYFAEQDKNFYLKGLEALQ